MQASTCDHVPRHVGIAREVLVAATAVQRQVHPHPLHDLALHLPFVSSIRHRERAAAAYAKKRMHPCMHAPTHPRMRDATRRVNAVRQATPTANAQTQRGTY